MGIIPRAGEEWMSGFVRDATTGEITTKITQGSVALTTTDIEVGRVKVLGTDGTTTADVLNTAPGSDSGQAGVAVRVISQLGAGTGGGGSGQIQVRNAGNVSTDVGYSAGDQKIPVDGSGVTQPVSGTVAVSNFPATQPVSLATNTPDITDRSARLLGHVTVDSAPTTAVTGPLTDTQLRASAVPVSMATQTPDVTDRAARLLGHVTVDSAPTTAVTGPLTDTQLRASAVPVTAAQATAANLNATVVQATAANLNATVAQATAANLNATVTQQTLTKGTQGATGVSTQDLKDAGRVGVTITGYQVAGIITTEALFAASLVRAADGTAAAAAAQHTVTAGKRFRVESIMVTVKNTAAAAGTSKLALRYRPAGGTVAITDSIIAILDIGSNNATAANYIGPYMMPIPDGFELIAASTFGFTNLSSAATMLHTITVVGFEY